jgi:hypothetical protein
MYIEQEVKYITPVAEAVEFMVITQLVLVVLAAEEPEIRMVLAMV